MFLVRRILGVVLIVFGVTAAVLPVIPGFPLVIIGLELIGLGFLIPQAVRERMRAWGHVVVRRIRDR